MTQKILLSALLAGFLLVGTSVWATAPQASPQSDSGQQAEQATKMVVGKVAAIGNGGTSFQLEVGGGDSKQMLQFTLSKNAKVQGNVKVGTAVTVEYAVEQGQNVAVNVTAQG